MVDRHPLVVDRSDCNYSLSLPEMLVDVVGEAVRKDPGRIWRLVKKRFGGVNDLCSQGIKN